MPLPTVTKCRVNLRYVWLFFLFAIYFLITWWADTSICITRSMTGFPCPGCGLTTAALALVRGDLTSALKANALIFMVLPLLLLAAVDICRHNRAFTRITRWIYLSGAIIMVIYFIFRMILYFPDGPYPMNIGEKTIPRKVFSLFS